MIPILYDAGETAFVSNGLGRLRDCISCTVTEERNGIFECVFEYPQTGAHFDMLQPGRIIAVRHDDTGDLQPFDIVGYTKPIDGVVTFQCVHISYRQSGIVAVGSNINTLADAFTMLESGEPSNPFTYSSDFTATAFMASADGTPRSVRQFLGGIEGSILDAYGGEYEFDRFQVILHKSRGVVRDFSIRYGVNMLDYNEQTDYQGSYTSCVPYWSGQDNNGVDTKVIGDRVDLGVVSYNGRNDCVALDLSDKFETMPTKAEVEAEALAQMQSKQTSLPASTITVDFVRLQDMPEYEGYAPLFDCRLCDTVRVIFPYYGTSGEYKIVKTVYNVLHEKFDGMELGTLQTSLAEALGISQTLDKSGGGGGSMDADDIVTTLLGGGYYTEHFQGTRGSVPDSGYCYGAFDPVTGMVVVAFTVKDGSTMATSTDLFTIPAKYRPADTRRGVLFYGISGNAPNYAGYCSVNTNGVIRQGSSNNFTLGIGVIAFGVNQPA